MTGSRHTVRWDRLDNTAHLFPIIASESMTNTYRISVVLREEVDEGLLQQALDIVLHKFDLFNVRLRRGFFWYYFEENGKKAPRVTEENTYPCRYINASKNHSYLFRVTYYQKRINLEVFHVLTDGMGGVNFLKELTYQYLRLSHPERLQGDMLMANTSMNTEDGFLSNYRKAAKSNYVTQKAYQIKGERLAEGAFGVVRAIMPIDTLKHAAKSHGMSINDYLVGAYIYGIYHGSLRGRETKRAIRVAIPVNLRPFFDSYTTKNFFAMISADFMPEEGHIYTFPEVLEIVHQSIRSQLTKENLTEILSYNVSNQVNPFARFVPLPIKNLAIKAVYTKSALANSTTLTNMGCVKFEEAYDPYIEDIYGYLSMSKGQLLKATVFSYREHLSVTFTTLLKETAVMRSFIGALSEDGIDITIETNGVFS